MTDENNAEHKRRIDKILSGAYTEGIESKSDDEVRELMNTAREVETEFSFLRRLAQSRMDIFKAEQDRRENGGSLSDLIAALPSILASGDTRSSAPNSRLTSILAPAPSVEFKRGMETLVSDESLANLDRLSDDELKNTIEDLKKFEEEVSKTRKDLHEVINKLESEIAQRAAS